MLKYDYGTADNLNDVISRLDNLNEDSGNTTVMLESYKYLGLSTVVERDHLQGTLTLTYIGTPDSTGTGAGDRYRGLDRFGRVSDQKWTNAGGVVDEYKYAYDRDSNVTSKLNVKALVIPATHSNFDEEYDYDNLNRLTAVHRYNGGAFGNYQSFTLDALGNIGGLTNGTSSALTRTYNAENQMTTIETASGYSTTLAYDNNGNLTSDDQGNTLIYDAWNRLVVVKDSSGALIMAYAYDGLGRKVSQTDSEGYATALYYSAQWQVLEERHGIFATAQYVYSPVYVDAPILRDRDTNSDGALDERLYFTQDANYNVTSAADTSGTVQQYMVYDAYGNVDFRGNTWAAGTNAKNVITLQQGGRFEILTGLVNHRGREYSITLMRWIQQDPWGYVNGANLYQFVADSPIKGRDPTGLVNWSTWNYKTAKFSPRGTFEVTMTAAAGEQWVSHIKIMFFPDEDLLSHAHEYHGVAMKGCQDEIRFIQIRKGKQTGRITWQSSSEGPIPDDARGTKKWYKSPSFPDPVGEYPFYITQGPIGYSEVGNKYAYMLDDPGLVPTTLHTGSR